MLARSFAFLLLVAAALADNSGAHSGAFYFVLAAGPVIVVSGLMTFGDLAEARGLEREVVLGAQGILTFLTLALVVVVGSGPGPLLDAPMPVLGVSALGACLGIFVVQAVLGLVGRVLAAARHPVGLYARAGEEFATAEHIGL
ncbi:MAG TPA: hypothetical protein VIJ84_06570 [Gaiellaceae bacterium]